ncbi:Hypothetical protein NTJ_13024 [Nesidiocoris tenuis]|uniref:Uncharacterized protein n=1 Tax=Nesidiocoris tenuis TaxID=355587 RepID=A0ABN7BBL2_9HEMI|nr:Hypothetical protein NTJ_13024 [Nesidiocoris tenuis]
MLSPNGTPGFSPIRRPRFTPILARAKPPAQRRTEYKSELAVSGAWRACSSTIGSPFKSFAPSLPRSDQCERQVRGRRDWGTNFKPIAVSWSRPIGSNLIRLLPPFDKGVPFISYTFTSEELLELSAAHFPAG